MNLIVAVTGATGAHAAELLMEKSPWPVTLIGSRWGMDVCRRECGSFDELARRAKTVLDDEDLSAPIASGSVPTAGMVIIPCSTNTLGKVAGGIADSLITRAAHCHLKEGRRLVLCVRESPWTLIDLDNARKVAAAGGVIMPLSPPCYMVAGKAPDAVSMTDLLGAFADRVLAVLGRPAGSDWETVS
jgi:4-hydroxy-3-polyprenylbenzoate decarboxylase